ncbi:MFS transporter [Hymenobacter humi]|uniref:MFS transporter n=1 Tax=Hymenobacter humi TaxID=1411620 RepID=A0ABW2UBB1_9BACT
MSQVLVAPRVPPTRARIAIALFFFVSGFGFATWASRIPTIQHRLGLNEAQLGAVLLALPAGLMLTLTVTGKLLQRFSSRQVMMAGAVLYNLALGLLGFAEHTWQLAVLLFCFGCSRNLLNLSVNAQSVGLQALYDRSIIATFHGIWSVAGFAAAGLGGLLIRNDVPISFHFVSVSVVLTGLALAFFPGSLALPPAPAAKSPFSWPDKTVLKFGLITFASMACEGTFYDWSGVYFAQAVHAPKSIAPLGFPLFMVAMTTGRFLGDWLVGRFGIKPILLASGVLMSTGLLLAAAFPTPLWAGLGFVLGGFGVSCVVPLVFSLVGKANPLGAGAAIASVSTVSYFGFLLVPPLVGFVAKAASLRWSFALVALLGGLVIWLVPKLREEAKEA